MALGGRGEMRVGCVCALAALVSYASVGLLLLLTGSGRAAAVSLLVADGSRSVLRAAAASAAAATAAATATTATAAARSLDEGNRGKGEQRRSAREATVSALSNRRCMRHELLHPAPSLRTRTHLPLSARAMDSTAPVGERSDGDAQRGAEGGERSVLRLLLSCAVAHACVH